MTEFETIKIERSEGIAWLILNRSEKPNAMNPKLNREMLAALDEIEGDGRSEVLVLTGAGEAFSAGMDLKEHFHEVDGLHAQARVRNEAGLGSISVCGLFRCRPLRWSAAGVLAGHSLRSPRVTSQLLRTMRN
jgi:enoyl-CoA hydratase/carnithine racemase